MIKKNYVLKMLGDIHYIVVDKEDWVNKIPHGRQNGNVLRNGDFS